ncbi:MAG: FlgD immunoglobulin-like domain containing protein [Candidatus Electryonea clarkiae]|nr:FlgD immunoglobulin-like domain containing protein [Candidatus Electryonea clarkiae]MDP8287293.1 FlgD immunoglobulin-like domain containing protein [Candidatus Electryonea clarkiae]
MKKLVFYAFLITSLPLLLHSQDIEHVTQLYDFWGPIRHVPVLDDNGYGYFIADPGDGVSYLDPRILRVIDISNLNNITEVAQLVWSHYLLDRIANRPYIDHNRLYIYEWLVDGEVSTKVVDIRNPENPSLLGSLYIDSNYENVVAYHDSLIFTNDYTELGPIRWVITVLDDSVTRNRIWRSDWDQCLLDMAIRDTLAFAIENGYARIYDFSNPSSPELLSESYPDEGIDRNIVLKDSIAIIRGIRDDGNFLYYFRLIDISDPFSPVELGSIDNVGYWIDVVGDVIITTGDRFEGGWEPVVVDISNPNELSIIDEHEIPTLIYGYNIQNDMLIMNNNSAGISILDIHNIQEVELVSEFNRSEEISHPWTGSEVFSFYSRYSGVHLVDIRDPIQPEENIFYPCSNPGRYSIDGIGYIDDYLIIAGDDNDRNISEALMIVDIADHDEPVLVDTILGFEDIRKFHVQDNYGIIQHFPLNQRDSLIISLFDLSDPLEYISIGSLHLELQDAYRTAMPKVIDDDFIYFFLPESNIISIADFSDPDNVQIIEQIELNTYANIEFLYVYDSNAFIGYQYRTDNVSIVVYDISNPSNPYPIHDPLYLEGLNSNYLPSEPMLKNPAVGVRDRIFVAMTRGTYIIDISDPADLQVVDFDSTRFENISLAGDYIVEFHPGSIDIYSQDFVKVNSISFETPGSFQLNQNFPNPFNPGTNISFEIARAENVNLSIYDITGRLVTTLLNEPISAGTHSIFWNGNDLNGIPVASGNYFYRLNNSSNSTYKRMVLVK